MSDDGIGSDGTFRILVLADLSGRASRGVAETGTALGRRRLVRVDRDSMEDSVRTLRPEIRLASGESLRFDSLDDFRPEALAARLPAVAELRALRDRLADPRRSAEAAEEARARFGGDAPEAPSRAAPPRDEPPAPRADGGGFLDEILGAAPQETGGGGGFENIVRDVSRQGVERLRVPSAPKDRDALAARADAETAAALRAAMHDPAFAGLEASWRSVEFLVRRLDLGTDVRLSVLDVSRAEAFADVGVSGGFDESGLHRVLVENTVGTEGGEPWSVVVADWTFGATARDVAALLRLAKLASLGRTRFVAGANPGVVGCRSLGAAPEPEDWKDEGDSSGRELWRALRRLPEAARVALAWPRVILRAPYGAKTSAVEGFAFEEFDGAPVHESLLWGNPAFAVAAVLGRAFESAGSEFAEALDPELDDLPCFVVDRGGEDEMQPCAETWLRSRGVERAASHGLLPVLSVAGRPCVRLGNLDSLAEPRSRLF